MLQTFGTKMTWKTEKQAYEDPFRFLSDGIHQFASFLNELTSNLLQDACQHGKSEFVNVGGVAFFVCISKLLG